MLYKMTDEVETMMLFKWLYLAFGCVFMLNVITSPMTLFSEKRHEDSELKEKTASTWQDTIRQFLVLIAATAFVALLFFIISKVKDKRLTIIYTIIMINPYLVHFINVFSNVKTIGVIINNDNSGHLNKKEHMAILSLALLVSVLHGFVSFDNVQIYAETHLNPWLTDWIMISFYVCSIVIFIFFICSLIVRPLQLMLELINRIPFSAVLHHIRRYETKAKNIFFSQTPTKTLVVPIIEYSKGQHIVFRPLLWIASGIAVIIDVIRMVIYFCFGFLALIVWYVYVFVKQVVKGLIKKALWVLELSNKKVIAISFRVAIILGLGLTVVVNMYSPFLYTHESSGKALEFISSAIIIPVIFEWILSYKNKTGPKAEK